VWVTDPARAWCRTCGLDLTPEDVGRTYAVGMAELERIRDKFPAMGGDDDRISELFCRVIELFPGSREVTSDE
jgi:hypothetical protein